jgi:hypothetical protein
MMQNLHHLEHRLEPTSLTVHPSRKRETRDQQLAIESEIDPNDEGLHEHNWWRFGAIQRDIEEANDQLEPSIKIPVELGQPQIQTSQVSEFAFTPFEPPQEPTTPSNSMSTENIPAVQPPPAKKQKISDSFVRASAKEVILRFRSYQAENWTEKFEGK